MWSQTNANGNLESSLAATTFSPPPGGGPNALWAALRSGFVHDKNDGEYLGVRDDDGVVPSEKEVEEGGKESKGLLCCDGSLAACDGSLTAEDLGGKSTSFTVSFLVDSYG